MSLEGQWQSFQSSSPELFHYLNKFAKTYHNQWPGEKYSNAFKEVLDSHQSEVLNIEIPFTSPSTPFRIHLFPHNGSLFCSGVEIRDAVKPQGRQQGHIDRETGMQTGRLFFPQLDTYIKLAKRYSQPLSVLVLRILRESNSQRTHNSKKMDGIIKLIAAAIREKSRESDLLFRYDDYNFNIILPLTAKEGTVVIKKSFYKVFMEQLTDTDFSVAMGCGFFDPEDPINTDDMDLCQKIIQDALNNLEYGT